MSMERPVPSSRFGRLAQLGRLAGGIAGDVVSEGAKQLARGRRPDVGELLLSPQNAQRLADRLSEMRGAAMKVGQLLSMDSGHLLPPQLSEVLSRLRENAHHMPLGQVARVLNNAWGRDWSNRFDRFVFSPIAAASIGQVHEAVLKDGRRLAIKIQYPGIRRSIDSDVDNVSTLLRTFRLLPRELDFEPLLAEAKRQLHAEADYILEAEFLGRYASLLHDDERFTLPEVIEEITSAEVLAQTFMDGLPIDVLSDLSRSERDEAANALLELAIREVFEWGLVQTDPNFANYLYQPHTRRIQLLDFGATRVYEATRRTALRYLLNACIEGEDADVATGAVQVGYLGNQDPPTYRELVVRLLRMATEPARADGSYRFSSSDLASRMRDTLIELRLRSRFGRMPPPDILFLHRKLGGLYLMLTRLRAEIPVRSLITPYL